MTLIDAIRKDRQHLYITSKQRLNQFVEYLTDKAADGSITLSLSNKTNVLRVMQAAELKNIKDRYSKETFLDYNIDDGRKTVDGVLEEWKRSKRKSGNTVRTRERTAFLEALEAAREMMSNKDTNYSVSDYQDMIEKLVDTHDTYEDMLRERRTKR